MALEHQVAVVSILVSLIVANLYASALVATMKLALPGGSHRVGHFDGVRGIAALTVMVGHFAIWTHYWDGRGWTPPDAIFLQRIGRVGVSIFFMISAALFYERYCLRSGPVSWRAVYISRFFRIVPLYYLAIVIVVAIFLLEGHRFQDGDEWNLASWFAFWRIEEIMGEIDTRRPLNISWTLKFEWAFYFSLPLSALCVRLIRSRPQRIAILTAMILIGVTNPLFVKFYLAFFLVGMIAVEAIQVREIRQFFVTRAAAILAAVLIASEMVRPDPPWPMASAALTCLVLGIAFLPILLGNAGLDLFRRRSSVALGEWSFGIYLLHNTLLYVMFKHGGLMHVDAVWAWLALPVATVLTVTIAAMMHVWVEKPFIRMGRQLADHLAGDIVGGRPPRSRHL